MIVQCIFTLLLLNCVRRYLLNNLSTFHCIDYFVFGEIRTCSEVSSDSMILQISLNFCLLNLLLVRGHQSEIIIVKHLIPGRNETREGWKPNHAIRVVVKTTIKDVTLSRIPQIDPPNLYL